jgi:peptidyl-tRNA hydrolase
MILENGDSCYGTGSALGKFKRLDVGFDLLIENSQTKVALRCDNEEELLSLEAKARRLNLCARSIRDA